ncbi:GNAT family N-acetyltransferase [Euzebya rosea]|uniref:GNAT family N-acetyltransferase n=1 Tax=Euzebya rosea TaxID=2052804 RepID=UPI000D3EAAE0|nr:GNAT family N-acetyltransferase [Euzebya rosea]
MARIESLSAVTLAVADMDRSTTFYDALGLERVHHQADFTSYRCGEGFINLQQVPGPSPSGWGRVIVWVDDVDAMARVAVAAGGVLDGQPADAPWGERYVHCTDPDGHELSLARPIDAPVLAPATPEDIDHLLALNEAEVPAVGSLDRAGFDRLLAQADRTIVIRRGGSIAGFVVLVREGSDYASPNYRWFAERVPAFLYVDRVVVAPDHRRRGVGRALYHRVIDEAGDLPVLAEVNTIPRNDASLDFHAEMGFEEMGRLAHAADKEVAMLRHDPRGATLRAGTLATATDVPVEGEAFATLLRLPGVTVEQITSSATPDTGVQVGEADEWVVVLDGSAELEVAGEPRTLAAGDWIVLPAGTPHRVLATTAGTRWLAVHVTPSSGGA